MSFESGKRYRTIVVDPPWPYGDKLSSSGIRGAENHYGLMTLGEIGRVPIADLAEDAAHLYLWTTNAFLREAFDVLAAWGGWEYKTALTWVKPQIGMGHYFRNNTEHVLFAVRAGLPLPTFRNDVPTSFVAPRRRHSQKPEAFFDLVESMSPGPRVSVFERQWRLGWDAIGDELGVMV